MCINEHGIYILEKGPAILQGIMCTHAGAGSFAIYDGIPGENGHFPDEHIRPGEKGYETANGRLLYIASPAIMGMWMAGGGAQHGLTLISTAQTQSSAPFVITTWMPFIPVQRRIIDDKPTNRS